MWNPFRPKEAEVIAHWYALVPEFQAASATFYAGIETDLKSREVPGLKISRVEFAEGGLLSAKREYLRMTRERLVFDICAAPFGTSYFYSLRFAELKRGLKLWELVAFFVLVVIGWYIATNIFGFWLGSAVFLLLCAGLISLSRNADSMGLQNLDTTLLHIPVLGAIYEVFFHKETYYRVDTRLMFLESIDAIVKARVEAETSGKGVKLLTVKQHSPLLEGLYKPTLLPKAPPVEPPHESAGSETL